MENKSILAKSFSSCWARQMGIYYNPQIKKILKYGNLVHVLRHITNKWEEIIYYYLLPWYSWLALLLAEWVQMYSWFNTYTKNKSEI